MIVGGVGAWQYFSKPKGVSNEQLEISLTEPIIDLPTENTPVSPNPPVQNNNKPIDKLNKETGLILVNKWLKAKAEATGSNYNLNPLKDILTAEQVKLWNANSQKSKKR